jgi:soluble lytic murein transglycosylase-like protein
MSGGGKSSTSTSTVSIPPEVLARYNAVNARAEQVAQQPFTPYGGQFVAPLTQTQQAGIANVSQAAGAAQPYYQAAGTALLGGAAQAQPYYQAATQDIYGGQAAAAPLQAAAAQNIAGAQAAAQPYQGMATGFGLAGARQIAPGGLNVGAYMSPYTEAVAQPTYQALRQQQEQERQRMLGEQIRGGAFGGDRGKIAQANLAQQQNLATAQALGNIYQQGYGQALGAAQQQQQVALAAEQANRQAQQQAANQFLGIGQQAFGQGAQTAQQQAALGQQLFGQGAQAAQAQQALGQGLYGIGAGVSQGLAGLGTGAQQAALQGGQAQLAAGTVEQQTQQAQNQALYNQFLQQQGYPFQVAQFLANIAMGTGALSGSTTTTTQPSSFFSDERLKQDIEPIGKTFDGQDIVRFKYKGEPGTRIGLVAQDVEKRHPEAVGLAGGYKTVDYDAATDEAAARAPRAYGGGLNPWDGNSMGGGVFREDAGRGFAAGGAPGGEDILAQINALVNAHQGMFPYGKAGLYGGGMGKAGPYGSTLMQAPSRNLMTAPPVRQEPPYDARQAMRDVRDISQMPKTIQEGYSGLKAGLVGTPGSTERVTNQAGETVTRNIEPTSGMFGRAGEVNLRESAPARGYRELQSGAESLAASFGGGSSYAGNARGGAIRPGLAVGGLPYSQATDEYVPEDISKPITPGKLEAPKMSGQQSNDGKQLLDFAKTAAAIYGAGAATGGAIRRHYEDGGFADIGNDGGFGGDNYEGGLSPQKFETPDSRPSSILDQKSDASEKKSVQSAQINPGVLSPNAGGHYDPSKDDAQTAATLAAYAAVLAFSDRRLKDNIEPIGKLFDGQNVYRYNFKGDDKKQIGLMAQEVEKRYPDAVGLAPRKGFTRGGGLNVPEAYQSIVEEVARERGIPSHLLAAALQVESGWNPEARGRAGEIGLGQILPSTAARPGYGLNPVSQEDLRDPRRNIDFAASYIAARNPNVDWSNPVAATRALVANYNAGGDPNYGERIIRLLPNVTEEQIAEVRANQPNARVAAAQEGGLAPPQREGATINVGPPREILRREPKDFLQRAEPYLIPLLTGLGTMASSPSRYLGSAVLQGLMGAGQSYQQIQGALGEREKTFQETQRIAEQTGFTRAQAENLYNAMARGAYNAQTNMMTVYRQDGTLITIPYQEYLRRLASGETFSVTPPRPGMVETRVPVQPRAPEPPQQRPPEPDRGGERRGDVITPDPIFVSLPPPVVEQATRNAQNLIENPGNFGALRQSAINMREAGRDPFDIAEKDANRAARTRPERNLYLTSLSSLASNPGPTGAGDFQARVTVPAISYYNSVIDALPLPDDIKAQARINPSQIADSQAIQKVIDALSQEKAGDAGQRALGALRVAQGSVPRQSNSPEAIAKLGAEYLIDSQRPIDFDNYARLYRRAIENVPNFDVNLVPLAARDMYRTFDDYYGNRTGLEKPILEHMLRARIPTATGSIPLVQLITESGGNVPEWLTNWMITPAGQQVPGAAQGFTGAGYVNERTGVTPEVVRGVLRYFLSQRGST